MKRNKDDLSLLEAFERKLDKGYFFWIVGVLIILMCSSIGYMNINMISMSRKIDILITCNPKAVEVMDKLDITDSLPFKLPEEEDEYDIDIVAILPKKDM